MTLNAIVKFNNTEITEHGRTFSQAFTMDFSDIELAAGRMRRFRKPTLPRLTFNWNYLPDKSTRTADLREGRNFIHNIADTSATVDVSIQGERPDEWIDYLCVVSSYSENLIRNDMQSQCRYYNVSLELSVIQ